jgi:hypothetical protein
MQRVARDEETQDLLTAHCSCDGCQIESDC